MTSTTEDERLDAVFTALSDRTRRDILARLGVGEATVKELAEPHAMSMQAVSQHIGVLERCTCRGCRPGSSGGVLVFVKDTTDAITPVDVQPGELVRVGDRFGHRFQRPDVRDSLMWSVEVAEALVFPKRMQQVPLVPDECAVQQFAAAGPHPAFHDRVHAASGCAQHDRDAGA
jgi:Helix-turn-helix domain